MQSVKPIATIYQVLGLLLVAGITPYSVAAESPTVEQLREPVSVELLGGRSFVAHVDRRTDAARLWLRWSRESAQLLRPIRWDRVGRVHIGAEALTPEQFRQLVEASRPHVVPFPAERPPERILLKGDESIPGGDGQVPAPETRMGVSKGTSRPQPARTPAVSSLAIRAAVANWDGDVEVDGITLEVSPLDAEGNVVPVHGGLEVELIAPRSAPAGRPQPRHQTTRWTHPVRRGDFGAEGARYRLPFSAARYHPEFDRDAGPYAAIHARLSVPGQGVFSATESTVRVRPYSAMRDGLEQLSGRRFFPRERTGDGRR